MNHFVVLFAILSGFFAVGTSAFAGEDAYVRDIASEERVIEMSERMLRDMLTSDGVSIRTLLCCKRHLNTPSISRPYHLFCHRLSHQG